MNGFFYIRNFHKIHTCGMVVRTSKHPRVNFELAGKLIFAKVCRKPLKSPMDVIDDIKKDYGLDITYHSAWLGVENARNEILSQIGINC